MTSWLTYIGNMPFADKATSLIAQSIRVIEDFGTQHADKTIVHPLALGLLVLTGILILSLPRRFVICSFIVFICFVSPAQRIVLVGLDFHFTRLLVLAGLIRIAMRGEWKSLVVNKLDIAMAIFTVTKTFIYTLQQESTSALINQLGVSFDWLVGYVVVRCVVRSPEDLKSLAFVVATLTFPVAIVFLVESTTGRNMFAVFGGVPEMTEIRQGKLRCQGPFPHPIIAGCFWASLLPLLGLANREAAFWKKYIGYFALLNSLVIILACNSSTPVGGVAAAMVGIMFFPLRGKMKWVVLATFILFTCLHFVMKAPVWHLISRISFSQGSTSYFRFQLIDNAISRFGEWALLGTTSTAHWFWGAQDVTNQYILEGVRGGFATLVCFVVILVFAFQLVGKSVPLAIRGGSDALLVWGLGVMLFVHCMNFLGVSYFGQASFLFVFNLAIISAMFDYYSHQHKDHGGDYLAYEMPDVDHETSIHFIAVH